MRKPRNPHKKLFATKLILSAILPAIAGAINASGFLALGVYTSHVTGHVTRLGGEVTQHHMRLAFIELMFVLAFIGGVMTSTSLVALARARSRSRHAVVLLLEAGILTLFAMWPEWERTDTLRATMTALLCCAMGMQNALVTQAFGAVMRTTHLTGICTDLGIETTRLLFWIKGRITHRTPEETARVSLWRELTQEVEWAQLRTHASVLSSYFCGAVAGTYLSLQLGHLAMASYCFVLVGLAYFDLRWGIRRLDL